MEKEFPDFSPIQVKELPEPPAWLETRLMARVSEMQTSSGLLPDFRFWKRFALGILVLHLFSLGLLLKSDFSGFGKSVDTHTTQGYHLFSIESYSYPW
jgi:hypothetical protein